LDLALTPEASASRPPTMGKMRRIMLINSVERQ
jgi:hypothetical protein